MTPTKSALCLLVLWLLAAAAASLSPGLSGVWLGFAFILFGVLLLDGWLLVTAGDPSVERELAPSIALGTWSPVKLHITSSASRALEVELFDRTPTSMRFRGQPQQLAIPAGTSTRLELRYQIYPEERGEQVFDTCDLRVRSPLGLLRRRICVPERSAVRVYPNFRAVTGYSLLATDNRTSELGIKKSPRRGEGLDFHQLREYRQGDALRQIEWRATARLGRLISREYQDERDQQVLFLLDCGRKMHTRESGLSHFDHALNSVLLLAYVALRQGDAVGLLSFSGEHRWLAPRKSSEHLNRLLNTVYDLQTSARPSDYLVAAREVASRMRKRTLVIWITNLRDEEDDELQRAIRLLSSRHLVLVASVRERSLREALEANILDLDDALRHAATQRYLSDRERSHARTRASGVSLLDVEPERLPIALVNRYLDIKSRRIL